MNEQETLAYAVGINMAEYIAGNPVQLDRETIIKGMQDTFAGKPALDRQAYGEAMQKLQQMIQKAGEEQMKQVAEAFKAEEKEFMAKNGQRAEVKTTASGLQYEVLTEGAGKKPGKNDTVKVHYVGTLLNGDEFDSSVRRGEPAQFGVGQVIAGWTEALQLMSVGSKYKLYIPSKLAYGERGAGQAIPPCAALVFEVELLDIL